MIPFLFLVPAGNLRERAPSLHVECDLSSGLMLFAYIPMMSGLDGINALAH